ncbi:MAG: class E sortase [Ilumatobacteraceae bacterium]
MLRRTALTSLAALSLVACGNGGGDAAGTTAVTEVSTTTSSTTSTSTSTTSTSTTTTAPTTTTSEPLPVPQPAPDPRANEPVVQVGTIEMPKIGVTKPMFEGVSLTVLDNGPGHWPGTAMPGHRGNVVIAGHRTSHDRPFRNIDQLALGDEVIFTTEEGRFVYEVTGTEVVTPDAVHIINQSDGFTATMFACHPPGSTRQRIVVYLRLQGS